ncbi:MAG: hypothetical protein L7V87_08600 [Verrucomicrobiales bacterium]|nr:hypothetical protein [Verrucomicrobiales bacterium]
MIAKEESKTPSNVDSSEDCSDEFVILPAGFEIGYRKKGRSVARTSETLQLGAGHHFLLAKNGGGKTTLLATLAGLLPPLNLSPTVRGAIHYFCDDLSFNRDLCLSSILRAFLPKQALQRAFKLSEILEIPFDKKYGALSRGNKQKIVLAIAETLAREAEEGLGDPCVLLLDEPISGIDYVARQIVSDWRARPASRVCRLVSHHPDEPVLTADSVVLIHQRKIEKFKSGTSEISWATLRESFFAVA